MTTTNHPRTTNFSRRLNCQLLALVSSLCFFLADKSPAAEVVLVCPEQFRVAAEDWIRHRDSDGLSIDTVASATSAADVRQRIRDAADSATRYVVLMGDAPPIGVVCDPSRQIPTHYRDTTVTRRFGSTPTLASDLSYGMFGDDQVPDAAVGRIPVTSPAQVQAFVRRLAAYEQSTDFGSWRGQVELTAGVGGFGMLADAAIESVTRAIITGVLPGDTKTSVAYASPGHRFYPRSGSFQDHVIERFNRGSRFWVYAGHGWIDQLDRVPPTPTGKPVLDAGSISSLGIAPESSPIALLLACYTGAFDATQPCLAESMMMRDGGPIATIAGSRVTMPYGNTTAAVGLIGRIYDHRDERLGDVWLETLVAMNRDDASEQRVTSRKLIDALATLISPSGTKLADERREHMSLYNLLGDPTLRLHPPQAIPMKVESGHLDAGPLTVRLESPLTGELRLEVDLPLGSDPPESLIATGAASEQSPGHWTVASATIPVVAGQSVVHTWTLPDALGGAMLCRAKVDDGTTWASGSVSFVVTDD